MNREDIVNRRRILAERMGDLQKMVAEAESIDDLQQNEKQIVEDVSMRLVGFAQTMIEDTLHATLYLLDSISSFVDESEVRVVKILKAHKRPHTGKTVH